MGLGRFARATEEAPVSCQDSYALTYEHPQLGPFSTIPGFPDFIPLNASLPPPFPPTVGEFIGLLNYSAYPQVFGKEMICQNKCKKYLERYSQQLGLDPINDFTISAMKNKWDALDLGPYGPPPPETDPDYPAWFQHFLTDPLNSRYKGNMAYFGSLIMLGFDQGEDGGEDFYRGGTRTKTGEQFPPYDENILTLMKTPADFPEEQIAFFDQDTYRVEFDLPLSEFEERMKEVPVVPPEDPNDPNYDPNDILLFWQLYELFGAIGIPPDQLHGFINDVFIPSDTVKVRGWYIKGQGVEKDNGDLHRPLIIMHTGQGDHITASVETNVHSYHTATLERKMAAQFAHTGFDVLMLDTRGHGTSQGRTRLEMTRVADDIFPILRQLESGEEMLALNYTGDDVPTDEADLLPAGAEDTSVILYGMSLGGYATNGAMLKHLMAKHNTAAFQQRYPSEDPDDFRNFSFKGLVAHITGIAGAGYHGPISWLLPPDILGLPLPPEVEDPTYENFYLLLPTTYENSLLIEGFYRHLGLGSQPDSEFLNYLQYLPALCVLCHTRDETYTIEGPVEAYNRCRGFKRIYGIDWPHFDPTKEDIYESLFDYHLVKTLQWIVPASNQPLNKTLDNVSTTTVEQVLCRAPSDPEDPEELKGRLRAAHRIVGRLFPPPK
jgi:pimeloyl-ACP methyl ester carboxylesterase